MPKAILYDQTQCVGCKECEAACAKQNGLPYSDSIAKEEFASEHKFTYIAAKKDDKFVRRLCMHCGDPACASVCPVGALEKTKLGPVTYDAGKCMGCRYCMVACPFGVPKYEWSKAIPAVRKCVMCEERVKNGKQTSCAEACPTGATLFGDRDQMLAEARKRLAENPSLYLQHIYGEKEVGGTSVLTISSLPFTEFGLPAHYGADALPALTGRALEFVPNVVTVGASLLGGIYWITNRREAVSAAEGKKEKEEQK